MPNKNEKTTSQILVKIALGTFLFLSGILLTYLTFMLWPTLEAGRSSETASWVCKTSTLFGSIDVLIKGETCLILLVILASCLGSFVHIATSFVYRVGNKTFQIQWVYWYVLRLLIGVALALVFYFVLRGGLLTTTGGSQSVNPFGVAGVAGLVGLFSNQATMKLKEVFDTIFKASPKDEGDE